MDRMQCTRAARARSARRPAGAPTGMTRRARSAAPPGAAAVRCYRAAMGKPLDLPFDPIERAGEIWEATWGPASAMRVATSVMRVQQILIGRYDEILRPHGLTFARYE